MKPTNLSGTKFCNECHEHKSDQCYLCSEPLCALCEKVVKLTKPDPEGYVLVGCCPNCGDALHEYHHLWMPVSVALHQPFPKA